MKAEEPPQADFHADALTEADVDALKAFLDARMKELADRYPADSNEARTARALASAAGAQIDELRLPFRYDDGEPERLKEKLRAWNYLMFTLWPWLGTEGYETERWRLIEHTNADAAAIYRRGLEQ
jgi:hypothetical protein